MNKLLIINNREVSKVQIGDNEYKLDVYYKGKFEFNFKVSLQPVGNDLILPTYQPNEDIPTKYKWIEKYIPEISDWILEEEKRKNE